MSSFNAFAGVFLIAAPPFRKSPTKGVHRVEKKKKKKDVCW